MRMNIESLIGLSNDKLNSASFKNFGKRYKRRNLNKDGDFQQDDDKDELV